MSTAEQQTAYDVWRPDELRLRVRDNDDHVAVMIFDVVTDRFMRVNVSREDFHRIAEAVSS